MFMLKNVLLNLKRERCLTWEAWAEACNRTPAALKKIVDDDSNPTAATLSSILAPLGASLEVITVERLEQLNSVDSLIERVNALEELCEIQRSRIEKLDEESTMYDEKTKELMETIKKQQSTIDTYIQRMYSREQAIDRKDARIVELEKRLGIW